jgi:hypothetical protein
VREREVVKVPSCQEIGQGEIPVNKRENRYTVCKATVLVKWRCFQHSVVQVASTADLLYAFIELGLLHPGV